LAQQGDLVQARTALQRASQAEQPTIASPAAISLARVLTHQGDIAGAQAAYQLAIQQADPKFSPLAKREMEALDLSDIDQRVLKVLDESVGLDEARIASSAFLTPAETETALRRLISKGHAKAIKTSGGRERYIRISSDVGIG
jgi:lipopolysaccharide biosynthesis regulator YciM